MGKNAALDKLSREELLELIDIYAKNWLALDGVWFQPLSGQKAWTPRCTTTARPGSALRPSRQAFKSLPGPRGAPRAKGPGKKR